MLIRCSRASGTPVTRPVAGTLTTPTDRVPPHSEHHIAASLFHKYPAINSIVHISNPILLAFAAPGSPPLRATSSLSSFVGASVPVFDIAKRYPKAASTAGAVAGYLGGLVSRGGDAGAGLVEKGHLHDMLVNTKGLGDALADAFTLPLSASASALEMAKSLTLSPLASGEGRTTHADVKTVPDFAVMLLRGNGAVFVGTSVEEAVFRSILTVENAAVQRDAMLMRSAANSMNFALQSRGGGSGQHGEGRGEKMEVVGSSGEWNGGLASDEMRDATRMVAGNREIVGKAWRGWVREVRTSGKYVSELDELVGGKK